ncbi:hypothetical protein C0995_001348 [Termitomyces sp. Mi166|nr:hypothetical protein C0995_001348 [Termitomyces sp. Mi166\
MLDFDHSNQKVHFVSYTPLDNSILSTSDNSQPNTDNLSLAYLYLTTSESFQIHLQQLSLLKDIYLITDSHILRQVSHTPTPNNPTLGKNTNLFSTPEQLTIGSFTAGTPKRKGVQTKKKYKPVTLKVKPVAEMNDHIHGDPLVRMPALDPNPKPFILTGHFTQERKDQFIKEYDTGFLHKAELNVLVNMIAKQNEAFAWKVEEKEYFKPEYFLSIVFLTVPHVPWTEHNHPIPSALEPEICKIIHDKISTKVYEPSNSSYKFRWFCILKKNGKL